jgi:hypothetical protein
MKALLRFTSILLVLVLLMPVYLSSSAASNTAVEFFPTTKEMKGWSKEVFDGAAWWISVPMTNNRYLSALSHGVDSRGALTITQYASHGSPPKLVYTHVGKDLVVDLKKTPYLFFDFTMYGYVWSISLKFGEAGYYNSDKTIYLNQEISRLYSQYLVDTGQYGLPGDYQGRIDLNKMINDQGHLRSDGSSFEGTKIRIVGLTIQISNHDAGDFAQFRHLSIGSGTKTFAPPPIPSEVKLPQPSIKQSSILSNEKKYYENTAIRVPVDTTDGWQTNISRTELGKLSDKSAFLKVKTSKNGMTILPTGQSIKQKAYINGLSVGWPKLSYTFESPARVVVSGSYLFYDFTMNTNWDIYLKFADSPVGYISLADVLNGLDKEGIIRDISTAEGTRGFGIPGTYKGAINLEEVALYYMTISGTFRTVYINLIGVDIVYENAEDKVLTRPNIIRELVIGNPLVVPFDAENVKDTLVTVNKPDGYNVPGSSTSSKTETTTVTGTTTTTTKPKDSGGGESKLSIFAIIIPVAVIVFVFAAAFIIVLINKNKKKNVNENKEAD